MWRITDSRFILGATSIDDLPKDSRPEFAFIGRSNVGKSTLINRLCNNKKLARTSNTPGCTRQINIFEVKLKNNAQSKSVLVTDLPGYGFAKLSITEKKQLSDLIDTYIESRKNLKVLFILNDIRRYPLEEELILKKRCFLSGVDTKIIVTKCDKVSSTELKENIATIATTLNTPITEILTTGERLQTDSIVAVLSRKESFTSP